MSSTDDFALSCTGAVLHGPYAMKSGKGSYLILGIDTGETWPDGNAKTNKLTCLFYGDRYADVPDVIAEGDRLSVSTSKPPWATKAQSAGREWLNVCISVSRYELLSATQELPAFDPNDPEIPF